MLHFEGTRDFPQPPAALWPKLSDIRFLVQCVPGVEGSAQVDQDRASWTLRPGLSFMRGKLDITLDVVERQPETRVKLRLHGKGIGSTNTVEVNLTLAANDSGSQVQWTAHITELGGLLKAVPQGLIKASALKVINDVWQEAERRLGEQW
jgi:carbon monoxide dehydrogenase subunit G